MKDEITDKEFFDSLQEIKKTLMSMKEHIKNKQRSKEFTKNDVIDLANDITQFLEEKEIIYDFSLCGAALRDLYLHFFAKVCSFHTSDKLMEEFIKKEFFMSEAFLRKKIETFKHGDTE